MASEEQNAAAAVVAATNPSEQVSVNSSKQLEAASWRDHWATHDDAWRYVTEQGADVTFFKYLEIAKDGGLTDITGSKDKDDHLWYPTRYISALLATIFLLGNTAYVIYVDVDILRGTRAVFGVDDFLLTGFLIEHIEYVLDAVISRVSSREINLAGSPAKLIAIVELIILAGLWFRVCKALLQMLLGHWVPDCCPCGVRFQRLKWFAVQHLFFDLIPTIGVYSSLLMLFPAAPKVFAQDLFTCIFYRHSNTYKRDLLWLVFSRLLCFVVGFDSFLVKFREGASRFIISTSDSDKTELQLANFVGAALLLNQILGVVQLSWMVRERLFRFVFAGEDGVMSSMELVKRDTWNALIARKLFESYGNCVDKFTMLLTFSDDDFQRLTLHEGVKTQPDASPITV
mmetsp:Transcript_74472/g.147467  ORF Transcript_74472/g.147467 Transcript_74472/m.147467 type:complete len:400 (+) Transcript_74472:47-1246(+)